MEARALPVRIQDWVLGALPEDFKYQRGLISMRASMLNLRSNGFHPKSILDIGAFRGDWSRLARRIYPQAAIYMLDANPELAQPLDAAVRELGRAEMHIALLGAQPADSRQFYLIRSGSSVLPENTSMPRSVVHLPMTTLDCMLAQYSVMQPCLLKVDVQGFELEVLRGAEKLLPNVEVVILEVSLLEYNQGSPLWSEVVAFMRARGFVVYDICGFFRRESDRALFRTVTMFARQSSSLRGKKYFWNAEAEFAPLPMQ